LKVLDNLYAYLWPGLTMNDMVSYGNNCNSYLIANALPQGKHILIDPGHVVNAAGQHCLERLLAEIDKDGIKIEDIALIIYTHAHPDHYEAGTAITERSGAKIAVSEAEAEFMNLIARHMAKELSNLRMNIPEINADIYLYEGELDLGEGAVALQILETPGHSTGHIGVYWPEKQAFFGGDLIFNESTGRVDAPGGSPQKMKESIEKVSQLEIEYLLTGHQYGSSGIITGKQAIKRNFDFVRENVFPYL